MMHSARSGEALRQPCTSLPGVGAMLAQKLEKCGIRSIGDLLFYVPFRYQDRTHVTPIGDLRVEEYAVVLGKIVHTHVQKARRSILQCVIEDKSGSMSLKFFHFNPQQHKVLSPGRFICAFGEVRPGLHTCDMIHPEYQLLAQDGILRVEEHLTPIYHSTAQLTQSRIRNLIKRALTHYAPVLQTIEWLSENTLAEHRLLSLHAALHYLHAPPPDAPITALEQGRHPAIARIIIDELAARHASLLFAKQHINALQSPVIPHKPALETQFLNQLPFSLTDAQQRVYQEIRVALAQARPMLRLVQGDVGSGKTLIAALSALQAVGAGFQVALMAPTDILSEQLSTHFQRWFTPLGFTVHRLTGKMRTRERTEVLTALKNGSCHIIVGTHALFQESVIFHRLGLVLIDEQHRFGVAQRLSLTQKGQNCTYTPHQLLLTATPIPRTLAMSHCAHIDVSIIDTLPPGRLPITTSVLAQNKREAIIARLQTVLAEGRQAYWVCPLIEASEKLECIAAIETAQTLQSQLPAAKIGLIHGRMKAAEKEAVMSAFQARHIDLLVATTVIEVGVDIPNASLMIIDNAERLGLSQLHQLRGRVGRGSTASYCLLLYQGPLSRQGQARLNIMRETQDGFIIAEEDLALRGAGALLGEQQTGFQDYKIAQLQRDKHLLPLAASLARTLISNAPDSARMLAHRWTGAYESYLQG